MCRLTTETLWNSNFGRLGSTRRVSNALCASTMERTRLILLFPVNRQRNWPENVGWMFRPSPLTAVITARWTLKYNWQSTSFVKQGDDPKVGNDGVNCC